MLIESDDILRMFNEHKDYILNDKGTGYYGSLRAADKADGIQDCIEIIESMKSSRVSHDEEMI